MTTNQLHSIFQFFKVKRGYNIPLVFKLINNFPLSKKELKINDYLNLERTKVTIIPDNLYVKKDLDLCYTKLSKLPNDLRVDGLLHLNHTLITQLPNDL